METSCCNDQCKKVLEPGQVVYEVGPMRYCESCVVVNVVRYPRLEERRATVPRQRSAPDRRGAGRPIQR